MSSSSKQKSWGFYIFRRERIKNSDYKKLLGIEVDTNLNFILTHNLVLPLWMFHSRILNSKINRLHERCMRLIYGNKATSFGELLQQDKTVSCVSLETCKYWPQKCLQFIEICLLLFSVNYFVDVISAIIFEVIPILQYQMYNLFLMEAKAFPT